MKAFGPVPSRRLGQSLGINNIPPKICSYACVYCQLGKAIKMQMVRQKFYDIEEIINDIESLINKVDEKIDFLTFVPDGEPTLDINLGKEIDIVRKFGIPVAVISNASLIWDEQVRNELAKADWVSLKIDAVSENIWKKIDRPYKDLSLKSILNGIEKFASSFKGTFVTESMFTESYNDEEKEIMEIAEFISGIKPDIAYISVPTRPTARDKVKPVSEKKLNEIFQIFENKIDKVEYLIGYEGNTFAYSGNITEDILSITAVHPLREEAMEELLKKANASRQVIDELLQKKLLTETNFNGKKFYLRTLKKDLKV